ncbi:DNA glycosylase AlkZ-like family protein [Georgenia sp. Z1344]|uniref:DNA glycosylase AlkZ-like family protein n=1 Tax=Georgenia sp. Z1344 TaxID=3416706 RepID=UPI003CF738B2
MTPRLSPDQARRARLDAHLLAGSDLSPTEVVDRAVALQGQDLAGVLRAVAIRSRPGTTLDDVRAAFDAGEIVRSWPMRGTLFATTPAHLATLLSLTAERIQRQDARRRGELGLDDAVVARAREVLGAALAERPRTRAEVLELWTDAGIPTDAGRGYHLIAHLAIDGDVHWGSFVDGGSEQLLTASSPTSAADPEQALAQVLRGCVAARGPVAEADLAWWLKLPKTQVRRAAAEAEDVVEVEVDGTVAWMIEGALGRDERASGREEESSGRGAPRVDLAPAFDEWILGYQDRSLVASAAMLDAIVPGRNGVFRPTILVDGVAVGTWRFPAGRGRADAGPVVEMVERVPARTRTAIDRALAGWPHR